MDLIDYVEGLRAEKGRTKPKYMFGFGSYDVMQPGWQRAGMSQRETADMFEFITALRASKSVDKNLIFKLDGLAMSQDPRLSAIVQVVAVELDTLALVNPPQLWVVSRRRRRPTSNPPMLLQVYKKYPNMRQLSRRLGALLNEKLDLLDGAYRFDDPQAAHRACATRCAMLCRIRDRPGWYLCIQQQKNTGNCRLNVLYLTHVRHTTTNRRLHTATDTTTLSMRQAKRAEFIIAFPLPARPQKPCPLDSLLIAFEPHSMRTSSRLNSS